MQTILVKENQKILDIVFEDKGILVLPEHVDGNILIPLGRHLLGGIESCLL